MAEVVEIDIPGIGKIEAKNAATEATLKELVDAIKGLQKSTDKNAKDQIKAAKASGSQPGAGASPQAAQNAAKMNQQNAAGAKTMGGLNRASKIAGAAFTQMGKIGRFAGGSITQFGAAAARASDITDDLAFGFRNMTNTITGTIERIAGLGDSLESAANSLKNIPVVGGLLSTTLGAAVGAAVGVTDSFMKASSVGATFGGSVNEMSRAASSAGMTLTDFAEMLSSNGENLMLLGGTTEAGAKRFSDLTKVMRASGVNDELMRMGYSTKDINQGIMNYAATMGRTGQLQRMSTSQIASESGKYMKQLDALAKATGQQREEVQRQADALKQNAKVQTALAQIEDPEQRRKMEAYILSFPKEAQGAIADMISTGNMSTEEAVKLGVMLPGVAKEAMQFGRTLQSGGKINDQMINQSLNRARLEGQAALKNQRTLGLYADEFGQSMLAAGSLASRGPDAYLKAQQEQADATKKANMAEEVNKAKQEIAKISNAFTLFLANSGMINTLMSAFQAFTTFAQAVLMPAFSMLGSAINALTPIITDNIIPPFQILGSWINDAIIPIFERAWQIVSDTVGAIFDFFGITSAASDGLGMFEEVLYTISDFVSDNLEPILAGLALVVGNMVIAKMVALGTGLVAMTINVWKNVAGLLAMSIPFIKLVAIGAAVYLAFKGIQWVIEKVKGSFETVRNVMTIVFSHIKSMMFTVFKGILSLINKIPGFRGDFDDAIAGLDEKLKEESDTRSQAEKEMSDRAKKRIEEEAAAKKAAEDKEKKDAETREDRARQRRERAEDRSRNRREQAERDAIRERREEEKAGKEDDASQDMSDPISMLRSFAERNKSAFSEEAKALDQVDAARKEVVAANRAYNDAEEQVRKAKTDAEKKAAEEGLAAAKKRRDDAIKAEGEADRTAISAAARMKSAKEGKDTGPTTRKYGEAFDRELSRGYGGSAPAGKDLGDRFGKIAAHFEARGDAGTISSGHGDFGGKSYGAFQLASNTGDVDKFIKASGFEDAFKGLKVGSREFDTKWREMSKNQSFVDAQYSHAKKQHYDPQAQKLARSGMDLSGRGMGVQEAIMSTANQYGANTDVIIKALKDKDVGKMSDKDIINAIQDYKASTVQQRFRSSSAAVQAGVAKRIEQERTALLGVEGGPMAQSEGRPATEDRSRSSARGGRGETDRQSTTEVSGLESLIKNGINPTTIAFQDLNKKAIGPMMESGIKFAKLAESGKPTVDTPGIVDKLKTALGKSTSDLREQKAAKLAEGEARARTEPRISEIAASKEEERIKEQLALSMAAKASADRAAARAQSDARFATDPRAKARFESQAERAKGEAVLQEAKIKRLESELSISKNKTANATPTAGQIEQAVKDAKKDLPTDPGLTPEQVAQQQAAQRAAENTAATTTTAQETPESLLSSLNMKMDQLIAISRQTANINSQQLSVQRNSTGDLYA
jgi:hypothetical protein